MSIFASASASSQRAVHHPLRRNVELFLATLIVAFLVPMVGCSEVGSDSETPNASDASDASDASEASDAALAAIDTFIAAHPVDRDKPNWRTTLAKPPQVQFDASRSYYWKLETNVGEIRFKLLTDIAPMHASSTIYLTRLGYYDSLKFHRVISGFMAQGGDPLGNGRGGPGYKYAGEFSPTAVHDAAGILSMANAGPGTDGSQFFITFKATPQLNNRHTVFGKAESPESMKTIKAMEALGRPRDPAPPSEPLFIKRATIVIE